MRAPTRSTCQRLWLKAHNGSLGACLLHSCVGWWLGLLPTCTPLASLHSPGKSTWRWITTSRCTSSRSWLRFSSFKSQAPFQPGMTISHWMKGKEMQWLGSYIGSSSYAWLLSINVVYSSNIILISYHTKLYAHCCKLSLASHSHSSIHSVQEGPLMQLSLHTLYHDWGWWWCMRLY